MTLDSLFGPALLSLALGCLSHAQVAQETAPPPAAVPAPVASEALREKLLPVLAAWQKDAGFPGATACLVFRDGSSLELAVGTTERAGETPMPADARMLAGSIGKTFVAALALQLVAEKKLELDSLVSAHLGEHAWFARLPNAKAMTVRQLMNHTSGLVRYELGEGFLTAFRAEPFRKWKVEEQLAFLFDTQAPFAAGAGWDYSDTNYLVLGLVVDRLLGEPRERAIEERLLKPLGLGKTFAQSSPTLPGLTQGYAGTAQPFGAFDAVLDAEGKLCFDPSFEGAGGGYVSCAPDLARWVRAYFEGRAFANELLPEVLAGPLAPMLGRNVRYGLGAILREAKDLGAVRGHSGYFPGYLSEMAYYAEHGIGAAVQVNTSEFAKVKRPLGRVLDELVRKALEG
ncbi:MAG: beta-lactamase family protein [Planctomycetes bacterium]|nr:beta-lactamase family protein [Planctomycetota bacterium]